MNNTSCLPAQETEKIKKAFKDGKLDERRFNVDSKTRRELLSEFVGKENAEYVNTIYEKKLLLKNSEKAILNTIKEVSGISAKDKAELKSKAIERSAERQRRLYDPKEDEVMLNELTSDIYSKKYNADVSIEDAQVITDLAKKAKDTKEALIKSGKNGIWAEKVALDNYVNALRIEAQRSEGRLVNPLKEEGYAGKVGALVENFKISAKFISDNSRALVASFDNSLWFRQGLKMAIDPATTKVWAADFAKSWGDIWKVMKGDVGVASWGDTVRGKDAIKAGDAITDAVKAEIYGRQNFLNGRYQGKVGGKSVESLDISTGEEAYPTSAPSKIPLLGRFFKGSEVAYEVGGMRLRADAADMAYKLAEKAGVDMNDPKQIGGINHTVNSITGRGSWGKRIGGFERAANVAFFSLKNVKSQFDYITSIPRYALDPKSSGKQFAAANFLHGVIATGVILKLAQVMNPDDNKDIFKSTSSNFGKIRYGHMTIDLTSGWGRVYVAVSRILLQESTSAETGITKKFNSGYGSQNGMDVFWNFTEGLSSPMFSMLRDFIKQETFDRKKPTILGEAVKLVTPITIQNIDQFKSEPITMQFIGMVADALGLSANVNLPFSDWGQNTSKELTQFKEKVGEAKFKEANDLFNKNFTEWFSKVRVNPVYEKLTDEQKEQEISKKKAKIKEDVFKAYNFRYKQERTERLPKL